LQYCGIGPDGGAALAACVVGASSVSDLSLQGNPLGPFGVTHIGRALAKNAYLKKLDLADTGFGLSLDAVEALRDGIEGNETLESVDIDLNTLVPNAAELLLDTLRTKPRLTQFIIHERVEEPVYREILDAAAANLKASKKKKKKEVTPEARVLAEAAAAAQAAVPPAPVVVPVPAEAAE
jgi:Ran GTPase-activating protein (RanGAP) involved in mRNA processing and transport